MKMVKSFLLGSAASIAAIAGAQAADLPVKAKPVEYVKVCSLYGAGYYYIPGTQTCIRIGGFLRLNLGLGSVAAYNPDDVGAGPYRQRDRAFVQSNVRFATQIDVRSNTDYGVLRTYGYAYFNTGSYAGQTTTILTAYSQLAGFTVGKFKGTYYAPWSSGGSGNLGIYRPTDSTAESGIEYKWELGGGLSAAIGVFDPRRSGAFDRADTMAIGAFAQSRPQLGVSNSGYHMPDVAANVRIEQAWGGFHVGARVNEVAVNYNGATEPTGAPKTKYGYAVNATLNLKNLPTGPGDQLWATVGFARGQMNSLFSTTPPTSFAFFGPGSGNAYNTVAFGYLLDGVFDSNPNPFGGNSLQLTEAWTATLAYEHWWLPGKLKSSFYGNYGAVNYNETARAIICTNNAGGSRFSFDPGSVCNPNWTYLTLGSSSAWYPARDFEISIDVAWSKYDTASSGSMTFAAAGAPLPGGKPAGTYEIRDQSHIYSTVNFLRTW